MDVDEWLALSHNSAIRQLQVTPGYSWRDAQDANRDVGEGAYPIGPPKEPIDRQDTALDETDQEWPHGSAASPDHQHQPEEDGGHPNPLAACECFLEERERGEDLA